jgi:BNR repeat-like domain
MRHPHLAYSARYPFLFALILAILVCINSSVAFAAGNRFKNSAPDPLASNDDGLRTPADYEAALASRPNANDEIFVSRCRFAPFSTSVNVYSSFGGTKQADAIVGDTTFPLANNTICYNPQNESNIVVNPKNSQNVVTSANEYRIDGDEVYVSMNGGKTFTDVVLPGRTGFTGGQGVFARVGSCGDPALAFGPDGSLYYAGLNCNFRKGSTASGLAVSVSHDGGLHWGAPVMVTFTDPNELFNDKEWITVAPNGSVIVTWTRFKSNGALRGFAGSPIIMSISHDGGKTWNYANRVSDSSHPFNSGSQPHVAPDGTIYVAYEGATPSTGFFGDAIILARSSDGGKTFKNTELARAWDDYNCYPINIAQGRQTLSGEQFRINSFPSFAIDPTTGKMAITWADDQMNAGCGFEKGGSFAGPTSNQVKLITSSDGINWSAPEFLTATDPSDKVYPAVGFNAGRIIVTYYTRQHSPNTAVCQAMVEDTTSLALSLVPGPVCLDYAARNSNDSFANETRLTTQSSNPYITFTGAFIGDYTGAVVDANGKGYASWADFRGNPGVTNPNMDMDVYRAY